MMQDVWLRNQRAGDGPVLATVSILEPVEQAGQEVGHQHCTDYLQNSHKFPIDSRLAVVFGISHQPQSANEGSGACGSGVN